MLLVSDANGSVRMSVLTESGAEFSSKLGHVAVWPSGE
jgi:hypothetical protein